MNKYIDDGSMNEWINKCDVMIDDEWMNNKWMMINKWIWICELNKWIMNNDDDGYEYE